MVFFKDCVTPAVINSSVPSSNETVGGADLALYGIYFTQGLVLFLGGIAIALSILGHLGLRSGKEYILILGVTLFPAFQGLGTICSVTYRLTVALLGRKWMPTTKWFCALLPYSHLWLMFVSPAALVQTAISIDRLLLLLDPLLHVQRGADYAWRWLGVCFAHGVTVWALNLALLWPTRDTCAAAEICFAWMGRYPLLDTYVNTAIMTSAVVSVCVMAVVIFLYHKRHNQTAPQMSTMTAAYQQEKERRMTNSFAISTVYTLLFYVLPLNIYTTMITWYPTWPGYDLFGRFIWIMLDFNQIINLYIFLKRHKEIRIGFWATLKRKPMPFDVSTWQ